MRRPKTPTFINTKELWEIACHEYGLLSSDFHRKFKFNDHVYKIVGIDKSHKYPILCEDENGCRSRFFQSVVKGRL